MRAMGHFLLAAALGGLTGHIVSERFPHWCAMAAIAFAAQSYHTLMASRTWRRRRSDIVSGEPPVPSAGRAERRAQHE